MSDVDLVQGHAVDAGSPLSFELPVSCDIATWRPSRHVAPVVSGHEAFAIGCEGRPWPRLGFIPSYLAAGDVWSSDRYRSVHVGGQDGADDA